MRVSKSFGRRFFRHSRSEISEFCGTLQQNECRVSVCVWSKVPGISLEAQSHIHFRTA